MGENETLDSGIETDDFQDEFQCCVCLDLLYKPVVLACGHISCFWCVFKAMDFWQQSYCPVCRHPYNHFPQICQLLHFLLLKLYPAAYKRREREVIEEEKNVGHTSPQFDDHLSGSLPSKELNILGDSPHSATSSQNKLHSETCSSGKAEPSSIMDSSENIVPCKDDTTIIPAASYGSFETTGNVAVQEHSLLRDDLEHRTCKQVSITDLLCSACKQLLCRPVVLNCGHVYCEFCFINPPDGIPRCQVCQSTHPNGFPKVCLVIEHFLEKQFSKKYEMRREALLKKADCQYASPSPCSTQTQQHAGLSSSKPANDYSSSWSGRGPKVHFGVGCDSCGMSPIIGERYRCTDCVEKIGFDLCEACYKTPLKLPGRFNQQHTLEHKFEILQPNINSVILRLEAEQSEDGSDDAPEDMEDIFPVPFLSIDVPLDPEDGSAAPVSSDDTLEDRECTNSTI